MHPFDRDSFRATLDDVLEQRRGRIQIDFRLQDAEGQYHWFPLKARPVIGSDGEVVRVVGTLADVTEARLVCVQFSSTLHVIKWRSFQSGGVRIDHNRSLLRFDFKIVIARRHRPGLNCYP